MFTGSSPPGPIRLRWPASWLCPDCLSEAAETAALPEEGTLYSFVHQVAYQPYAALEIHFRHNIGRSGLQLRSKRTAHHHKGVQRPLLRQR